MQRFGVILPPLLYGLHLHSRPLHLQPGQLGEGRHLWGQGPLIVHGVQAQRAQRGQAARRQAASSARHSKSMTLQAALEAVWRGFQARQVAATQQVL